MHILIFGANGFIGSHLVAEILSTRPQWTVTAVDLAKDRLTPFLERPQFHFVTQDIQTCTPAWLEEKVEAADVILPLAAVANPALYVQKPLYVFQLDFEANLPLVRACVQLKKRLVFPSTSEVYGLCSDDAVNETTSPCITGPIEKQRWIYATAKQLMDRVIYAYGIQENLDYTLFRPFNWIGPNLDRLDSPNGRSVTKFLGQLLRNEPICLVGGGTQKRSFTDIQDGIAALMQIIENEGGCAHQRIFNLGNPANNASIHTLASLLKQKLLAHPLCPATVKDVPFIERDPATYYGPHYQDTPQRVPDITAAKTHLNWSPAINLEASLQAILDYTLGA